MRLLTTHILSSQPLSKTTVIFCYLPYSNIPQNQNTLSPSKSAYKKAPRKYNHSRLETNSEFKARVKREYKRHKPPVCTITLEEISLANLRLVSHDRKTYYPNDKTALETWYAINTDPNHPEQKRIPVTNESVTHTINF